MMATCATLQERILSIVIFVLGYYMYRPVLAHAYKEWVIIVACHHIMNMHDGN